MWVAVRTVVCVEWWKYSYLRRDVRFDDQREMCEGLSKLKNQYKGID